MITLNQIWSKIFYLEIVVIFTLWWINIEI